MPASCVFLIGQVVVVSAQHDDKKFRITYLQAGQITRLGLSSHSIILYSLIRTEMQDHR